MKTIAKLTLGAAATVMAVTAVNAQEASAEADLPAPVVQPIELDFDENGLSGPGAAILRDELERSQFVMIGEDHGFTAAPLLLSAFASEGKAHSFDHYAIEVGPYSTAWARDIMRKGGSEALAAELQGRPLALPFLSNREEVEAALPFLADGKLWGVDQEFIGSPLIHLEWLQENAATDGDWIASLAAKERESFAKGDQASVFMATATDQDWARLRAAVPETPKALARIDALQRSAGIYRSVFAGRGLENNLDRVEMIREYFLEQYHAAEARDGKPPRVVMKFGATHAGRATSAMSTFDLGSLIEGMAASNQMEVLHIAYLALDGEQLAIMPSPQGMFSIKPVEGEHLRETLLKGGVDLAVMEGSDEHFLIPLEPVKRTLRNKGLAELGWMGRFVVLGFDYLVTTNSGEPATPLARE